MHATTYRGTSPLDLSKPGTATTTEWTAIIIAKALAQELDIAVPKDFYQS